MVVSQRVLNLKQSSPNKTNIMNFKNKKKLCGKCLALPKKKNSMLRL